MAKLSNNLLTIEVNEHGAELSSIRYNGREYLWGAFSEYWKRHSPVLFPIVGSVWDGEFRSKGKTYQMGQHGIARDMDFTLISQNETEIWYELCSSEETLQKYPYEFVLRIGYKLHDTTVDVCWEVENPSDEEIAFQIGAHPAFYWPMLSKETIECGVEAMDKALAESQKRGYFKFEIAEKKDFGPLLPTGAELIRTQVIEHKGCVSRCIDKFVQLQDHYLGIDTDTFNRDALIVVEPKVGAITLCDDVRKPYLTLTFDSPLVGLWSPPKKNAPFVCIEPWYGRTDAVGYEGEFEDKEYMNTVAPHSVFKAKYEITLHS